MKLAPALTTAFVLCLLVGATPALAASPHSSHTSFSLTMNGAILDAGSSTYYHTGGQLVEAYIGGTPVDPSNSVLHYSLAASINGLGVEGSAAFSLAIQSGSGVHTYVTGQAEIAGMVPAEQFPLGCQSDNSCTSAIPGAFLGAASITILTCKGAAQTQHCDTPTQFDAPMQFESAFLNPFGGPIVMATQDNSIVIVATYSQSRVTWTGIQLGGEAQALLGGDLVSGQFGMTVSAVEDLRAGYELDTGTIAFGGSFPASLQAAGTFVGKSTIPLAGAYSCSDELSLPPGTCLITGFMSSGVFSMTNALGGSIKGSYSTEWIAPAVAFTSSVSATLK